MKEDVKKKKWPKRLVIVLIAIMLFGAGGFYAYVSDYYHAGDTALRLTQEMKTAGCGSFSWWSNGGSICFGA